MFSTDQLCYHTGLSYRVVDYWDRTGILRPSQPANGSGTQRRYSYHDLAIARALAQLNALRVPGPVLRNVATQLDALPNDTWPPCLIVSPTGELLTTPDPDRPCWIAPLTTHACCTAA